MYIYIYIYNIDINMHSLLPVAYWLSCPCAEALDYFGTVSKSLFSLFELMNGHVAAVWLVHMSSGNKLQYTFMYLYIYIYIYQYIYIFM